MGQGGIIVLVNGTKYQWDLTGQGAYQMEWEFGRDQTKIVEPCESIFAIIGVYH